jgi:hypothetical protein
MTNINHVTFPGLGLDFHLNEIAFSIGSLFGQMVRYHSLYRTHRRFIYFF